MAKVIIFGVQDFAQLASFYLQHDSEHEVVAFSVNAQYVPETKIFEGLPVIAFESVEETYPPSDFKFFAPMSPSRMNKVRESVYHQIKQKGYEMITYVSSKATVFPGTVIGDNCFILEDNTIQPFTSIGNNVVLWSGNHIGHHGVINDHVSFTSHVVMSGHCVVESFAFFGVNATMRDGIRIAEGSFIAMAAAVTKDTEAWGVYKGNPARKGEVLSKDLDW
jgi:sugar O-acyltransferase (sialic acid O-acetyltransferase NeuD family)